MKVTLRIFISLVDVHSGGLRMQSRRTGIVAMWWTTVEACVVWAVLA